MPQCLLFNECLALAKVLATLHFLLFAVSLDRRKFAVLLLVALTSVICFRGSRSVLKLLQKLSVVGSSKNIYNVRNT